MKKTLYLIFGWFSFALGFIGIFVPLMPTVVFWIIAAWCFTHSAPHLREKICNHPRFGSMIRDFLDHGVLSRKGKIFAVAGIIGSVALSLTLLTPPLPVLILVPSIVFLVAVWLIRRPELTPKEKDCASD